MAHRTLPKIFHPSQTDTEDQINYNSDASENEVPRKQSAAECAFMATPTKRLRFQSTSSVREPNAIKDQTMTGSGFIAKLNSIIHSDYTEFKSSRSLQDDANEDSDSDTSGSSSSDGEPELPPQQIHRKESKKLGGYIHPVESKEDRSKADKVS